MKKYIEVLVFAFSCCFVPVVGAVDMDDYVVFPHYCHEDPFSREFVCRENYASLKVQLDRAMDPFLDDYTTLLFEKHDSDFDDILAEMDELRDRVGSFSSDPDLNDRFLFVVEYVYYKISWAMEEIQ